MLALISMMLVTNFTPVITTQPLVAITPVVEQRMELVKDEPNLTSTSSVKDYVVSEAIAKGVDPKLVIKIVNCESGYVPQQSQFRKPNGERERSFGIWQINVEANDVTVEQAMDIIWSTNWSLDQLKKGNAKIWTCYK